MNDLDTLYVGKGDPLRRRLGEQSKSKDFWTRAVVFTSKDGELNTAHAQYLEARLIRLAQDANRCQLDNANTPEPPSLSAPDVAMAEAFLDELLPVLPVLGISAFQEPQAEAPASGILLLHSKGIDAKGYDAPQGFVVQKRSQAVADTVPSFGSFNYLVALRGQLLHKKVLVSEGDHLVLTQDYVFDSPSAAASILLGNSTNGRVAWKDANGVTLKELQATAAGDVEGEEAE